MPALVDWWEKQKIYELLEAQPGMTCHQLNKATGKNFSGLLAGLPKIYTERDDQGIDRYYLLQETETVQ